MSGEKPPAEAQQETCSCSDGSPIDGGCDLHNPYTPPAEMQQDDERVAVERIAQLYRDPTLARFAINDYRDWLAARPSTDAETLRKDECPQWNRDENGDCLDHPAEVKQDDERERRVNDCDCGHLARNHELTRYGGCRLCACSSLRQLDARAALSARPSADTETLRDALAQLERLAGDECGPLRMVVLDAVESVRAALDTR